MFVNLLIFSFKKRVYKEYKILEKFEKLNQCVDVLY